MARFVVERSWDDLSERAREELKIRVLDALGCALAAIEAPPVRAIRAVLDDFGGRPLCTLIGGGRTAPDRAALYNGALVRYLDFNDSYFAPGETCHPSDNLAPVLATAEYADASGRELLTALAVAYQVQCRLSDEAPVRAKGFDHTTQGAYAAAAGAAKALRLDEAECANAIAIAGTALNPLRKTVQITLARRERSVVLTVEDDGRGFSPAQVPIGRLGLVGMSESIASVNGALEIDSKRGAGTRLTVEIPLS